MVSVCLPSDALSQHITSYLGFSYIGRGVSLHGHSSKAQPLLLTLDEGYLLLAPPSPDLECGEAPLSPPVPILVIANTLFQQDKRRLYTWTSPDGQHWNQIDYNLCSQRWKSSIQSAKIRLGADSGSDRELLIAKFRLKLKKVGKTTRPFRYDLNQGIRYDLIQWKWEIDLRD